MALRPTEFNRDVLTLDKASLTQAAPERFHKWYVRSGRRAVEKSNHRHRRLLRPRRQRPRGRRAAEARDERAALHSITSSATASNVGGISRPSALAVLRLITSSYLVGTCTGRSAGWVPRRIRSTHT